MKAAQEYGDIVHFKLANEDIFMLNHPDYIKEVLVLHEKKFKKGRGLQLTKPLLGEGLLTSEGKFHDYQRKLIQPIFHREKIRTYGKIMVEEALKKNSSWENGDVLDISKEMMQLTLVIVGKTLFNIDVEKEAKEIGKALTMILKTFTLHLLPFSDLLEKLPIPMIQREKKALSYMDSVIYQMIESRKKGSGKNADLLSMLLLAKDEKGKGMSDKQVRDEVMTLFLAGHETTANALAWTWYLLSKNPEKMKKLELELQTRLKGSPPTVEDLHQLEYTEAVFSESLRLYPPAWMIGRENLEEYKIGGYHLPKGSTVFVSPYVIHHDKRFYPEPFSFRPERWIGTEKQKRPQYSFFPFGGGSRICIGASFAWMEGTLLTAALAQNWKMNCVEKEEVKLDPMITLRPKKGIKMKLIRKTSYFSGTVQAPKVKE